MYEVHLISGEWRGENGRWYFYLSEYQGNKRIMLHERTTIDDLEAKVFAAYRLGPPRYDVVVSYRLPDCIMKTLPEDTMPVFMRDSDAVGEYLENYWKDSKRLCVQFYVNEDVNSSDVVVPNTSPEDCTYIAHEDDEVKENDDEESEGNDDEDDDDYGKRRFDYCDDQDGASSGDDDYISTTAMKNGEDVDDTGCKRDLYLATELRGVELGVGQCYSCKEELETRLKMVAVLRRFDFDVVASTKVLLRVKCWVGGCQWKLRASKIDESSRFYVRVYVDEHTCSVTERALRARKATADILARLYTVFVGGVGPSVLPIHVANALSKRYGLKVQYWKAHRTLTEARLLVEGTAESGYEDLPSYLYMIRRANPGTVIKLEVDGDHKFKFLFLSFDASIQGFPYMRKVVVVDGTFLQGKYKGTLLTATMQDGNFNIFPIAFGVVDTENDESWEWFFTQLNRIIPDDKDLAIISDRHRSIEKAIKKVFPLSARGICTYHLRKNILLKFRGGESFKLFKRAATAYRIHDFNEIMGQIEEINPRLHYYLLQADITMWSRVHFPGNRYNLTTTNIAESINHALNEARTYPVVKLIDAIRAMLTRWFATRRTNASVMTTALTSAVEKVLHGRLVESRNYEVQNIDYNQIQVSNLSTTNVVNLTEKTCSCKRFDIDKIPCVHAVAAAEHASVPIVSLTHTYYHTHYLYKAYEKSVKPRDSATPVPKEVGRKVCKPPMMRKQAGRPKKARFKGVLETASPSKRPRKAYSCTKCSNLGHNARTCPASFCCPEGKK